MTRRISDELRVQGGITILRLNRLILWIAAVAFILGCLHSDVLAGQPVYKSIREVDFKNFTYQPVQCHKEYRNIGIGKSVKVKDGAFHVENMGVGGGEFYVNDLVYEDLNGDGGEEAIVHAECGSQSANFRRSELFVYIFENGKAHLRAVLNYSDLDRDYKTQFRSKNSEFHYIMRKDGVKAKDGVLVIEWTEGGSGVEPDYIVTMKYRLQGRSLRLCERPQRRDFEVSK